MKKLLALVLAACLLMTVVPAFATVADTVAASENLTLTSWLKRPGRGRHLHRVPQHQPHFHRR